ncbi:MAG: cobalt-precorrin-5B (C(1))-methyltransferase [Oligoflexia bacterium]|nr:cobalt-precorrin-5B (C(1))-methyltransferase [Oligoflexia bacterium]
MDETFNGCKENMITYGPTTGACAAAAATAALRSLLTKELLNEITIPLPCGKDWTFKINKIFAGKASVIKPYNSDHDCTIGAEIFAEVMLIDGGGDGGDNINSIVIEGGVGVAKVTKSGLGLEIGSWAINPVPRKHIEDLLRGELRERIGGSCDVVNVDNVDNLANVGVKVIISVPAGIELAKQTINHRLGLVGGISILGVTGLVLPYSVEAYKETITNALQVVYQNKNQNKNAFGELVFTTGGRTEIYAKKLKALAHLIGYEELFIQVADFLQFAIDCVCSGSNEGSEIKVIHFVGMMGKMSKIANPNNQLLTHVSQSQVDSTFLAELIKSLDAGARVSNDLLKEIESANTARDVLELCQRNGINELPAIVAQRAHQALVARVKTKTQSHVRNHVQVKVYLLDFQGDLLATYPRKEEEKE